MNELSNRCKAQIIRRVLKAMYQSPTSKRNRLPQFHYNHPSLVSPVVDGITVAQWKWGGAFSLVTQGFSQKIPYFPLFPSKKHLTSCCYLVLEQPRRLLTSQPSAGLWDFLPRRTLQPYKQLQKDPNLWGERVQRHSPLRRSVRTQQN